MNKIITSIILTVMFCVLCSHVGTVSEASQFIVCAGGG